MTRFWRPGTTRLWWASSLDPALPAVAALTTDTDGVVAVTRWAEGVPLQHRGYGVPPSPRLSLYEHKEANPLQATLGRREVGFLVIAPRGATPAPAELVDVIPVRSRGFVRDIGLGSRAAGWTVEFAVTGEPRLAVALV